MITASRPRLPGPRAGSGDPPRGAAARFVAGGVGEGVPAVQWNCTTRCGHRRRLDAMDAVSGNEGMSRHGEGGGPASRAFLPLGLLLALSTVFVFGGDRGHFYRPGHHDWVSSEHLAVAVNLSPEHGFLMFHRRFPNPGGTAGYKPYNRFPMGGYALLKLATLPFGDDLSAAIHAARMLMLLFFAAAAALAYLAMLRLIDSTSNRWIALTATLLVFSSPYSLYYNDMISPNTAMDLFGIMLTFHGMVVFAQEGRFRQLLVKACVSLLLGWHVFALLLAFIVLGVVSELVRVRSAGPDHVNRKHSAASAAAPLPGRYLTLGAVASLVGVSILTFNFANEWRALDGSHALTDLPSFRSMLKRIGVDTAYYA